MPQYLKMYKICFQFIENQLISPLKEINSEVQFRKNVFAGMDKLSDFCIIKLITPKKQT